MPDDLQSMESGGLREAGAHLPPSRRHAPQSSGRSRSTRYRRVLLVAAAVTVGVAAIAGLLEIPEQIRHPQPARYESVPGGGLLADVRGEGTLHRLEVTQAALAREVSLLRGRLSEGYDAGSAQSEMAQLLAELRAGQAHLGALVGRLEARQTALRNEIMQLEMVLATMSERFGELHLLEEGN